MANQDVFGIERNIGQAWNLDGAVISFGEGSNSKADLDNLIVTSVGVQYTRTTSQITPLNQDKTHIISGESAGTLTIGTIIGPEGTIKDFLDTFGKVCDFEKRVIIIKPAGPGTYSGTGGSCRATLGAKAVAFKCEGCLIKTLNMQVSNTGGGITVVNANVTLQILKLNVLKK